MKRLVVLLLAFCLVFGIATSALAAGAPQIKKHPVSQTTDKKGSVTFSLQASKYTDISWHFVNPETGDDYTGKQLRDELLKDVKGFQISVAQGRTVVTLKKVPDFMHGWDVYAVLSNNRGYSVNTERAKLWIYGKDPNDVPTATPAPTKKASKSKATATPAPTKKASKSKATATPKPESTAKAKKAKATATPKPTSKAKSKATATPEAAPAPTPEPSVIAEDIVPVEPAVPAEPDNGDGDEAYEPEEQKTITVTADQLTLIPVDSRGNLLEDQAASVLTFQNSGNVAVRSDAPVKYWTVNGIRIEPVGGNVNSFLLKNIKTDLSISARLDTSSAVPAANVDAGNLCEVTCSGCVFTYYDGGLVSVSSGSVPAGAAVIVIANKGTDTSAGYTVNGEAATHIGTPSFRLVIQGATNITLP